MSAKFISIGIPSYNRPAELLRLLQSIDYFDDDLEVVICEDNSPQRKSIGETVRQFQAGKKLALTYYENAVNLGYDRNIRELALRATGEYLIYMGDDDRFVPGALLQFIHFLRTHRELGYVLKSHQLLHADGMIEPFRYYRETCFFSPGPETVKELFRKSVFISGFTIKREYLAPLMTDAFDGTLLMQLYFLAEIALKHKCAYFDVPLTQQDEGGIPMFGMADAEKKLYTPGSITVDNSLAFLRGFFKITGFLDRKYQLHMTTSIRCDMAKYSYPSLAIQRPRGLKIFFQYIRQMNQLGFNCSIYYYIYIIGLTVLGKRFCDWLIVVLKKKLGATPRL